jgi:hypothetical protein
VACGAHDRPTGPSSTPIPAVRSPVAFDITFAADTAACRDLPAPAQRRTYSTTLSQGQFIATLTGATFVQASAPYSAWNVLYTKFSDSSADLFFQDPPIWEALSDESYLVIYGDAHGVLDGDTVTLPFGGAFDYCPEREPDGYPECEVSVITCQSRHHSLTLRRK